MRKLIFGCFLVGFLLSSHALQVTIKAHADKSTRPTVVGTTNLPDGTKLMVSVARSQIGFEASDSTFVSDGKFEAGPFGPANGLTPGTYKIEILMPIPSMQPANVRQVIGPEGQNLQGKLVVMSDFKEKNVEYTTTFTVSGQVDAKRDRLKKQIDEDSRRLDFCSDGCRLKAGGTNYSFQMCMKACLRP